MSMQFAKFGVYSIASVLALAATSYTSAPLNAQSVNISVPQSQISISVGRGKWITLPSPIEHIFIADDNTPHVQGRSPRQVHIYAKTCGQTSFYGTICPGK